MTGSGGVYENQEDEEKTIFIHKVAEKNQNKWNILKILNI